jgi:serine/threonine protein kinase
VLPFPASNIQDLSQKVKTESGKNLKFGSKNPNISNLSKDILKRLLEPNPSQRISWAEFFTHPIFNDTKHSLFGISNHNEQNLNSSYINPQHANAVNFRFQNDLQKAKNSRNFTFPDPLEREEQN